MPMKFAVTVDTRSATRRLDSLQRKQIPFATARALNAVGKLALTDLRAEMRRVLDQPTPYTLGAFALLPASKSDLVAVIAPRVAGAGRSAWTYLAPEVLGGPRALKGFELRLSAVSNGQFALPAAGVPVDGYGNVRQSVLSQVIAGVSNAPTPPARAGTSAAARGRRRAAARQQFVVAHAGNRPDGRPIGIYRVTGPGSVEPMFTFTKSRPSYTPRLDVEGAARASVVANWDAEFTKALQAALQSAR